MAACPLWLPRLATDASRLRRDRIPPVAARLRSARGSAEQPLGGFALVRPRVKGRQWHLLFSVFGARWIADMHLERGRVGRPADDRHVCGNIGGQRLVLPRAAVDLLVRAVEEDRA